MKYYTYWLYKGYIIKRITIFAKFLFSFMEGV
nr:MAG TPA: hypothetical protein [Caudoviricetes sp.]